MSKKFRMAIFKLIDILVIFTMVSASPMSITASAMAQDAGPALAADQSDYAPGDSARVTGSGFPAGSYVLASSGPAGTQDWGAVSADESGVFVSNSPALESEGIHEVRAYASDWSGNWDEPPVASTAFFVAAPASPTDTPTEAATAEPTQEPAEEPTAEPTDAPTEEPTQEPTVEPTVEPTTVPTETEVPLADPFIQSDKEDYTPGELVTLTGGNWQGDTQVRIFVNDNIGQTWSRDVIVDVAPDGTIVDAFNLPNWFVASYIVSAGGQQTGRVVTTTFTDAPGLTLVKSASPLTYTAAGQVISFTYVLTNTGTTVLNGPFTVTDNKVPTVTCPATPTLAVGASITCTGTYTITASDMSLGYAVNTATASSSNPGGTTSNPDVRIVSLPMTCRNDSDGANDEPGQKDLTQECLAESSVDPLVISWNWDIISRTGANSADGCALFDTDNDGLANYSMCVSWQGQRVMQSGYPKLYSCNDTRSDRCAGAVPVSISNGSTCSLELASDDPFSGGDSFPQDAKAFCSINLADVGGSTQSTLLDVCSYPSEQPNSDPSDCVVISQSKGNLNVIKNVVPDDASTNWNINVSGSTPFTDTLTGDDSTGIRAVTAGSYTITETAGANTNLADYTTTWACTVNGDPSSSGTGTSITTNVASGDVVVCTFTNTRQQATLIVKKVVVNDNGGTKGFSDFSFVVNGGSPVTFDTDGQNEVSVSPGSYTVTEPAVSGYTTTYNNCSNVSIAPGGTATCTITNDDQPGTLIVKKVIVNDNGGTKGFSDFSFEVNGGTAVAFESDGQNDITVNAGTYTVTEPAVAGYTTTYNNCSNVSVPNGGSATCTVTNNDNAATLIVIKHVINDNGGTAVAGDFTMNVTATNPSDDSFPGAEAPGTTITLDAGSYSVTETGPSGYTASYSADCSGTIATGQTKTCTVTNNDQPGTLIVKKVVVNNNGGTLEADDFTFQVNDGSAVPFEADGQNDLTVNAGTYTVTEPAVAGYSTSYENCTDLVIPSGGSATCTITNDDQAATLIVKKVVVNNNGGTLEADDFSFEVNGGSAIQFEADGQNDLSVSAGTYTIVEPAVSGYTTTYNNCSNVVIPNGGSATCTITNDDQPATLIVKKVVVNDSGGTKTAVDFSFSVNGGSAVAFEADGQNDLTVNAGTYTVTEPAVPGYTTTYDNCSDLVIPNGGTATCTITNNDQAATLIVKKVVVNDNGGTKTAVDFSFSVNGGSATAFEADGQNDLTVNAGTYTVTEPAVSGYTTTYDNCSDLVIPNGGSATCTITNDDQPAHLKLVKVVSNDNGGTAVTTDFTLSASGPTPISGAGGAESDVNAGTYTLSETSVPGYTASAWSCVGGTQANDQITLANGESVTCTITNHDTAPSLTLVKVVVNDNGGTAEKTDFALSASGPTPITGNGEANSDASFRAGTYTLSETGPSGYSASAWVCTGTGTQNGNEITLQVGQDATCTITNDDEAPSLTLVKQVVNDNGGTAVAADFTLTADGPTPISGAGGATSDATFEAGTYDLSETGMAGYTASAWSCTGGTQNGAQITLALGESATCTITNNDNAPSLTLQKVVVNDNGGTATAAQWTLTATGPSGFSGAGPSVSSDADFDAGTYALSETGLAGYTAGAWNCVGGTQNGSDITVGLGESATCTITNDDNAPSLTLVKVVVNDNGGTAATTAFTLSANGPTPISGAGGATSDPSFDAGTYDLSETGPAGYAAREWVCAGGTQDDADTITLGLGESATCTITNDDQAPSLTLVKAVTNDDGGDAVGSDWTLTAAGPTGFSGSGPSVSNGASFDAGTYDLSEDGPAGYTASAWVCVGGTQDDEDTITLGLGQTATCTITNDDVAPTLKLVKNVITDNGGNNVPNDWVLYAIAAAPNEGRNFSNLGGSGDFETVYANVPYDLSESMVAGYTAGNWSCNGGTLVGSTLTLAEGQTGVTCTITNDDSAPTLTLVKTVVNDDGGNAVVADFPLFIDGNPTSSGQSNTLSANTLYTASETTQPGYTASAWGNDCAANGTITLSEGQNATCTITNDDVAPTLKLVKVVTNDNGGNAVADDWTLSAAAATPFDTRNVSNAGGSGDFEAVFANQGYDLSETSVPGYTNGTWSCDGGTLNGSAITLAEGENVTCTITNDDIAPQLRIVKIVVNDDGGNAVVADFPLFIDGQPVTSGVFVPVTANAVHTATETTQAGYTASAWGGDCAADGTVTLNEGETKTCTITNNDVAPTLKLVKNVTNDDGGNAVADDWTLSATAGSPFDGRNFSNAGGSGGFQTVFANAGYDLNETTLPGYTAGMWSCDGGTLSGSTVTLAEGETEVTCTITNDDSAPALTLIKNVINDNGGNAAPDDFNLTIGGNAATSGTTYTLEANTPYTINETLLSGYSFVEITGDPECPAVLGGTVTLDEGENVTCTITNDDIAPTLTLIKTVINDHGGSAQPDAFNLTIGGAAALSGTAYPVDANTPYVIDETLLTGYSFVSITGDPECPAVLGGTVTLDEGENVTCTITNDDQPATLIVIKHVVNDNGGTAEAKDFTLDSGGTDDTPDNFAGDEAGTTITLDAGAYNVTETGPSGYAAAFSADCSGTVANGETKTCTVTNDDIQPQLIVIKHVVNDNGGTATAGQFTMQVSGISVNPVNFAGAESPGTNVALDAGSYSVAETGPAGYAPTFSADCTGSIAVGETKTCTITNDDISPTLTVVKVLLPSDDPGLFNLQIDGSTQAADVGDNGTTGPINVNAGSHTVGETEGTGTSLADYVTTIGGDCAANGSVSLALAENKTCTITNIRRGAIVIVKTALGGDGTFDFTSNSFGPFSLTTVGSTASTTFSGLDPANTYDVAESIPAGWELNSATCNSGETIDSIDLEPGETVTCTFENEKAGNIVIIKNTVGGDGTFDFTSTTLGSFSLTTASNTASTTFSNLDVDPTYDVAETVPSGWDLTSSTCDNGETVDSIDLEPGETVTCTFTNTKRGHIIVDKITLPSGDTQSFSFDAQGGSYADFNLTDAATPNDQELVPGTYSVTEMVPAGWDLTGLSCTDPSGAPVLTTNKATIDLAAGETVNCTFTNTKRGSITIIKDALPNDAQDFAFTSTIPGAASFSLDDDSNGTLQSSRTVANLVPGAYSVTEGAVAGWDLTGLTCNDANGTTDLGARTANIALDPGEEVTCTFTNTKRGTIIVEKQTNPNAAPGTFTFTGTAAGTIADNGTITVANLVPGTYTSTEADPSATLFALTSIVCNDGSSANPSTGNLTTRTATFRLDPGETVRCVFTNTKDFHAGTIGFWKNWRNHYTPAQFQLLINYLKTNNPKIYNKDLILNNSDDLTIAKHDAIMNVGSKTPREQMILAQFTALKFNLAITQLQGTSGLVQKNDNLCTAGVVNVSGISGATAFFGTSTPTVGQIVDAVENRWTGKLTTNRSDWKWNLTNAQKDMLIKVITGINEGTLVMSSGCP